VIKSAVYFQLYLLLGYQQISIVLDVANNCQQSEFSMLIQFIHFLNPKFNLLNHFSKNAGLIKLFLLLKDIQQILNLLKQLNGEIIKLQRNLQRLGTLIGNFVQERDKYSRVSGNVLLELNLLFLLHHAKIPQLVLQKINLSLGHLRPLLNEFIQLIKSKFAHNLADDVFDLVALVLF
jgi:hypothetical protein